MMKAEWLRRINILVILVVLAGLGLGFRLFQKQIVQSQKYLAQAENQYFVKEKIPASRGTIYTSDMFPLATNSRLYQILAIPRQIKDKQEAATKLAPFVGKPAAEIFDLINNDKYYVPPLRKRMTEAEGEEVANLKIKGITIMPENVRMYPAKELAAQVLGFVDADGNGHYGVEGFYNSELRGVAGTATGSKDTKGRIFSTEGEDKAINGANLILTIDQNIQYQAEKILKNAVEKYRADLGTLTVIEPRTGKILAMSNYPSFDPNEYNKVPVEKQGVFNNTAVSVPWEPGSVFKPLIMSMAINEGKVQSETRNNFAACVKVDSYDICTSTGEAYGDESMTQVLENSDNVAMVWLSDLLGKETMYNYLQKFGFGRKTGIELDSENSGSLADVKKWSNTQRATISFGQGISATPLQLLMATAAIANNGKMMQPYIVQKMEYNNGRSENHNTKEIGQIIGSDTANKVASMMVSVVENGHGKKAAVKGYKVAGKTGTAEVPKPGGGYYTDRHIGSFVGFAPAENARFAMIVRLDNPKNTDWAESSAAPTFGEMAAWLLTYLQVPADF